VGNLDIIGGAYECLISCFAASAGKKAGALYAPAEVSELLARLGAPRPVATFAIPPAARPHSLLNMEG
jgi:type I restriction enzyme M protein